MAEEALKKKIPPVIYAEASVRSLGGVSLFDFKEDVVADNVNGFYSEQGLIGEAVDKLRKYGFAPLWVGGITITIAAPADVYEKVFKTRIIAEEREAIKHFGLKDTATFLDCPDTEKPGLIDVSKSPLKDILEGVALNEPVYYFSPSAFPPAQGYWRLDVPAGVSLGLRADLAHRLGYTGRRVRVAMVDSGWYRHPYFTSRGYRFNPVVLGPAATEPEHDEHGHGTGESANIFAVAPDVNFTMVKMNFVNSIGAFNTAAALKPHIISCSWGSSKKEGPLSAADNALAAAVASAVAGGITVVFSAGNGHYGFPGQHPDVISAGGVFMKEDLSCEATPYASGFASNIYSGRNVPDVCGLVGLPPRAQYIMLPVEPGDTLDSSLSGGSHPNGDETAPDDGWAAFSGTSAAAPQLAGVCACMLQAYRKLSPSNVKDILKQTARDITKGHCSPSTGGNAAVPGPDLATGHGLADTFRATMKARGIGWGYRPLAPGPDNAPRERHYSQDGGYQHSAGQDADWKKYFEDALAHYECYGTSATWDDCGVENFEREVIDEHLAYYQEVLSQVQEYQQKLEEEVACLRKKLKEGE